MVAPSDQTLRAKGDEVAEPYRESAAPPQCAHANVEKITLYGGAGPDYADEAWRCLDCLSTAWKWCDGSVSTWRPYMRAGRL